MWRHPGGGAQPATKKNPAVPVPCVRGFYADLNCRPRFWEQGGVDTSFISLMQERRISGVFGGSPPNKRQFVGRQLSALLDHSGLHYSCFSVDCAPVRLRNFGSIRSTLSGFRFFFPPFIPPCYLFWRLLHGRIFIPASVTARW